VPKPTTYGGSMEKIRLAGRKCSKPYCKGHIERTFFPKYFSIEGEERGSADYQKKWRLTVRYVCSICSMVHIPDEKTGMVGLPGKY